MNPKTYAMLEEYMLSCMQDSAHDSEHVYRVLNNALEIAREESPVDEDVLVAACLLHDIGRKEQFENPSCCHAQVGAEKAFRFLMERGFDAGFAEKVRHCIATHRFRSDMPPESTEAKILFDADKLDVTGALGVARTLMYKGGMDEPIYTRLPDGRISDGTGDSAPSFFREYKFKLEKLYGRFFTARGAELARERRPIAEAFYKNLLREVGLKEPEPENDEFRFATEKDTGLILSFIKELAEYEKLADKVVADEALLSEWIFKKQKAEVIFALENGREVGFALFFHNFSTFLGRAGIYLEDLYVKPEFRGRGYGKALLGRLAKIAVERGCGRLEWWCLDWNKPSVDFYLSLGAQPMSEWTTYRFEGEDLQRLASM